MNAPRPPSDPPPLWEDAVREQAFRLVSSLLAPGPPVPVPAMPAAAAAFLAWSVRLAARSPVLWITDGPATLDQAGRDLTALAPPDPPPVQLFPLLEARPGQAGPAADAAGARLRTLRALAQPAAPLIAACVQALLQPTLHPDALEKRLLTLHTGSAGTPFEEAVRFLEGAGYRFEPEIHEPGEAAVRGGLLDAWPPAEEWPLRIEFFGPAVESIRTFDPETQRSRETRSAAVLTPVSERHAESDPHAPRSLLEVLPPDTVLVWSDFPALENLAATDRLIGPARPGAAPLSFAGLLETAERHGFRQVRGGMPILHSPLDFEPLPSVVPVTGDVFRPDLAEQQRHEFLSALTRHAAAGRRVLLFLETEGALHRFLETAPADVKHAVTPRLALLSEGFTSAALSLTLAAESDLYGRRKIARTRRRLEAARAGPRLADFSEIQPGDLVVHVDHGIGRYRGLAVVPAAGRRQESLVIEYADNARLHVPADHAHLLTRYIGMGRRAVRLHALGGRRWQTDRGRVESAVQDLAAAMLETQAARDLREGHAFQPDTTWQRDFETSFPFRETEDQLLAIADVKRDMESPRPMDRLICGDAGYGKTEVAIRAAFKAVMEGKQVAVLVPTTVLAQQHFFTFAERMNPFPVRIEMFSRLCAPDRRRAVLADLRAGACDIVIGTHGLFEPDVAFKDLGLVIVDEEQRFGVAHKERFKQWRRLVDVLTLSATPIPRTLYMSLTGLRDLSLIRTPPSERLPVETLVAENTDEVVSAAIRRELARGGQVYFLHNRVHTIEFVRNRLAGLVPEARLAVAHGQMPARALSAMMREFVDGAYDVLLCTTIVESGMDIPNANTILIERADRFGMADLYQLRGRTGRSKNRGYCYMLLPRHGLVDPLARSRIQALRRHSDFGAGFRLAMRDLEIRGAGNMLGHEQSGHIAAVGFALYCKLLRRTVARLKHARPEDATPPAEVRLDLDFVRFAPDEGDADAAGIPDRYIEDEALRIAQYRRLGAAATPAELEALRRDWRDRFGPPPEPVERLLLMAGIRAAAARRGFAAIETRDGKIHLIRPDGDRLLIRGRLPRFTAQACTDRLRELGRLLETLAPPPRIPA